MNEPIKIAEAKAHFCELVARAEAGEEILISRGNKPVARIVPLGGAAARRPGIARHWKADPAWADLADAIAEPVDEDDQAAAEGAFNDEFGITLTPGPGPAPDRRP